MAKEKKQKKQKQAKAKTGPTAASTFMKDLKQGRALSIDFFRRNAWLMIVIMVAVLSLMGLRYKTKSKMAEIKKLEIELTRAESSKLQEKAAYMSLIRETEMGRLVREKGLGLEYREQPPFEIEISN